MESIKMSEEPDRFKEILEEIFDSKIEIIQMIDTIDKKLEKLILARNFDKSEHKGIDLTVMDENLKRINQPVKKESKTKVVESTTKTKTKQTTLTRPRSEIIGELKFETEKAYLVKGEDGKVAWLAKSNLTNVIDEESKDARFVFKVDKAWMIDKLDWKEDAFP